jgi:hypothetical protein
LEIRWKEWKNEERIWTVGDKSGFDVFARVGKITIL